MGKDKTYEPNYICWYGKDFQADVTVRRLTPHQRLMLRSLLQEAFYCSSRPYLPEDDEELAILADADSLAQWKKNKDAVMRKFTLIPEKGWLNNRVYRDWLQHVAAQQNRSEGGKASARSRATDSQPIQTTSQPSQTDSHTPEAEVVDSTDASRAEARTRFNKVKESKSESEIETEKEIKPTSAHFTEEVRTDDIRRHAGRSAAANQQGDDESGYHQEEVDQQVHDEEGRADDLSRHTPSPQSPRQPNHSVPVPLDLDVFIVKLQHLLEKDLTPAQWESWRAKLIPRVVDGKKLGVPDDQLAPLLTKLTECKALESRLWKFIVDAEFPTAVIAKRYKDILKEKIKSTEVEAEFSDGDDDAFSTKGFEQVKSETNAGTGFDPLTFNEDIESKTAFYPASEVRQILDWHFIHNPRGYWRGPDGDISSKERLITAIDQMNKDVPSKRLITAMSKTKDRDTKTDPFAKWRKPTPFNERV
jgi:uncharacterized protein YdaU (DUF1376 family)